MRRRLLFALFLLCLLCSIRSSAAQSAVLPQPALLPSSSPLCSSPLVPCLDIDDLAAHAYAHLLVLPVTELRSTAFVIPYGLSIGLFGRVSGGISSHTSFWSQSGADLRSQGPLRLSVTLRLWPLLPLRSSSDTPASWRTFVSYDHELRFGPFDGASSLGIAGDLSSVRVVTQQSLGLLDVTLSFAALLDPLHRYATGEAAAQLGFRLPFLRSLALSASALARGAPSYVHPDSVATIGSSPIPIQAAAGVGISYQPHARVDFGASVTRGVGGLAPWSVLIRFVTLSVGKQYQGSAATPLTEIGADLTALAAQTLKEGIEELLKETYAESPIDPKLDHNCFIRDDDGSVMGSFGSRTPDGRSCEQNGVRVPIGKELWRDKHGDRLCNASRHNPLTNQRELYDCVLWRNHKEWQPAHQARLTDRCELRDDDGRLLAQVGQLSSDGNHCRYPVTRDNGKYGRYTEYQEQARDKIFYTDQERSRVCETPNLRRCFLTAAEGRSTLKMEQEERFARGADRAVTNREQSLQKTGEAIDDLATGKVSLTTIKDAVTEKTKKFAETVTDKEKLRAFAKGRIADWLTRIDDWSKKRSDDQVDDAGELAADAVIDAAAARAMGMAAGPLGLGAKELEALSKAERKAAKAAPNPHGSHGALDHRLKVRELEDAAKQEFDGTGYKVQGNSDLPEKSAGLNRRPDVAVVDRDTKKTVKIIEVGRTNESGAPVPRERKKFNEYDAHGIPYEFHPLPPKKTGAK